MQREEGIEIDAKCELIDLVRIVGEGLLLLCVQILSILLCADPTAMCASWVLGYCKEN